MTPDDERLIAAAVPLAQARLAKAERLLERRRELVKIIAEAGKQLRQTDEEIGRLLGRPAPAGNPT